MQISRRKLLATAAATVPAAAVAAIPAPAAPLSIATPAYPFEWYHSYDGEVYNETFSTMEAALRFLEREGKGMIAECQRQDFDLSIDGASILHELYNQNESEIGEGDFIDCTRDQENELGNMVTAAIEQWVRKNKINISAWTFGVVRNQVTHAERFPPITSKKE